MTLYQWLLEALDQNEDTVFTSQMLLGHASQMYPDVTSQKICDTMSRMVQKCDAEKVAHGKYRAM